MTNKNHLFLALFLIGTCSVFSATAMGRHHNHNAGWNPWGGIYEKQSPGMQRVNQMSSILAMMGNMRDDLAKIPDTPANKEERASLTNLMGQLKSEMDFLSQPQTFQKSLGDVFLKGFAGKDAGEFGDLKITNAADGITLGLAVASAQAMSTVVKKHVESTADLLIGGIWDRFINKLVEAMQFMNDGLLHNGHRPLQGNEIKGLSIMVNKTFVDLNIMLRDGLKDMLRGQDMTLRLAEDQQDTSHKTLGWRMLVSAYTRQIDYIISLINLRVPHYNNQNDPILFYAKEIIQCLEDVKNILSNVKNIRELDERLDSNKNIINAIKNNIQNLFERLLDLIETKGYATTPSSAGLKPRSRATATRDADYDDDHPHSFHG